MSFPEGSSAQPGLPGFLSSTLTIMRLTLRRTLRGSKVKVALVAAILVVLFPAVIALAKDEAEAVEVVTAGIDWGFYRLLVFLLPLMFTVGLVSEETEARTLHFLAMRPVQRASIALGKYIIGVGASLAVMWAALLLLHLIGFAATPTLLVDKFADTARAGGAASLLLVTYSAVTLFWGVLVPEAAAMVSVVWLGFVEWFGTLLPSVFRFMSMNHFARELGGLERAGWDPVELGPIVVEVPFVELHYCALIIASEWLVFLVLALVIMQYAQLRFGRA
ncbi:MAG: ABC transporter permease [Sandaracinaceae bacterium]